MAIQFRSAQQLLGNIGVNALSAFNTAALMDRVPEVTPQGVMALLAADDSAKNCQAGHDLIRAAATLAHLSAALTEAARKVVHHCDVTAWSDEDWPTDHAALRCLEQLAEFSAHLPQ